MKVSIYGIGTFGFALLKYLDGCSREKLFSLHAFDRDTGVRENLRLNCKHPYKHPGIKVSRRVIIEDRPEDLLDNCDVLILCVTSDSIREVIGGIKSYINKDLIILNTAKALDYKAGGRLSELIIDLLQDSKFKISSSFLSGGMVASDVIKADPLGADLASNDGRVLKILKSLLNTESLNIYTTTDLAGVEYAGAFKNIISILSGIINGLGFTYGSETYIISRAANELKVLAVQLGAREETFSSTSQCWGNDMIMSATGNTRNREFGVLLGKGLSVEEALSKMHKENKTVEGINTARVLRKIIGPNKNEFPLISHLGSIIFDDRGRRTKKLILDLVHSNTI